MSKIDEEDKFYLKECECECELENLVYVYPNGIHSRK
jgi:hypothetical protein